MRKQNLFSFIFIMTISGLAIGQDKIPGFGLIAGLNHSRFVSSLEHPISYQGKFGYHLGAYAVFPIDERLSFRPQIIFSSQGSDFNIDASSLHVTDPDVSIWEGNGETDELFLYIPLMAEYRLSSSIAIELGPQLGYMIDHETTYDGLETYEDPDNDELDRYEIAVAAGGKYFLDDHLGIGLRYLYGIVKRQELHNSMAQLSINYSF